MKNLDGEDYFARILFVAQGRQSQVLYASRIGILNHLSKIN